jgi:hypothetical protein
MRLSCTVSFSNEAKFHSGGIVSRHNWRIRRTEPVQEIVEDQKDTRRLRQWTFPSALLAGDGKIEIYDERLVGSRVFQNDN